MDQEVEEPPLFRQWLCRKLLAEVADLVDCGHRVVVVRCMLPEFVDAGLEFCLGNDDASAWAQAAEVASSIATEITADADLLSARTFAELHDYCDANCRKAGVAELRHQTRLNRGIGKGLARKFHQPYSKRPSLEA